MYVLIAILSIGVTDIATPKLYTSLSECERDLTFFVSTKRLARYECRRVMENE